MAKPIGWYVTQHEPNKWCHPTGASVVLSEEGTFVFAMRPSGDFKTFSIKECGGQAKCEQTARDWAVRTHHARKNPAKKRAKAQKLPPWVSKKDAAKWRQAEDEVRALRGHLKDGIWNNEVMYLFEAAGGDVWSERAQNAIAAGQTKRRKNPGPYWEKPKAGEKLWSFEWVGGGGNEVFAKTKREAVAAAKKVGRGDGRGRVLVPDAGTFSTDPGVGQERRDYWNRMSR